MMEQHVIQLLNTMHSYTVTITLRMSAMRMWSIPKNDVKRGAMGIWGGSGSRRHAFHVKFHFKKSGFHFKKNQGEPLRVHEICEFCLVCGTMCYKCVVSRAW